MATIRRKDDDEKDAGMRICDRELEQTQARLSSAYRQAAEELTANFEEFMKTYEEQLVEMQEKLEAGEITQEEYARWARNKLLRSQQMQSQINSMTEDLVNVDQLAMDMLNNDLVGAYVTGYNFSGFRGEMMAQAAGYDYASFSIYSRDALSVLMTEDPDLIPWTMPKVDIPKDKRWNRLHLQNAITQGILQGDNINQMAKRLLPVVNMDKTAAMRTARTSYTGVQNQGRREATARIVANGIPMVETWMSVLASNTRDTHLLLHGTHPNKDGLFGEGILKHLLRFPADPQGDPDQIYNCQCRVNSLIEGIDSSNDDELYEKMMKEQYYEDWVGDKEATGVRDYKTQERASVLERKRQLESGEIISRQVEKQKTTKSSTQSKKSVKRTTPIMTENNKFDGLRPRESKNVTIIEMVSPDECKVAIPVDRNLLYTQYDRLMNRSYYFMVSETEAVPLERWQLSSEKKNERIVLLDRDLFVPTKIDHGSGSFLPDQKITFDDVVESAKVMRQGIDSPFAYVGMNDIYNLGFPVEKEWGKRKKKK